MKTAYHDIIEFIDAAIDSGELMQWLSNLEKLPDNLRENHMAEMKKHMVSNNEPRKIIGIMEAINNPQILQAVNSVIKEVNSSGMKAKSYLGSRDNPNFSVLISLLAGS